MIHARIEPTFESFRDQARALLAAGVAPEDVTWDDGSGQLDLFALAGAGQPPPRATGAPTRVPATFVRDAEVVACHSDPARWALLYRIAYRLVHGEPWLLGVAGDPDVTRLRNLVSAVRRDEHRMHAFLRFRPVGSDRLIAWYEPDFDILPLAAPFFVRRFPSLSWVIATPRRSAAWDTKELKLAPGVYTPDVVPAEDELDDLFRAYYSAIFNPARANVSLFEQHVPSRFRANMPETAAARDLIRAAPAATRRLTGRATSAAHAWIPRGGDLVTLARAAQACQGCSIHERATQAVFGEGPTDARIVLVGEQPGDEEDLAGQPFVGPAGKILDDALRSAGVERSRVYVTNAVKHFKWEPRGKRRLHSRPNPVEVHACRGWLDAELGIVKPDIVVCLGSTAARAFFGRNFRTTARRGEVLDGAPWARKIVITHHPAFVLRLRTAEEAADARAALVHDLALAGSLVEARAATA